MAYFSFAAAVPVYFETITTKLENGYPGSLILSVKDGKLSKNIAGPLYMYPISDFYTPSHKSSDGVSHKTDTPKYILTIDDSQKISLESYATSNAVVFFGQDGFISKSDRETKMQSYSDLTWEGNEQKDFSFSKDTLTYVIDFIAEYVPLAPLIIVVSILVFYPLGATLGALLFNFLLALIVMLLSKKIVKRTTTYGESYVLALYALPSVVIVLKLISFTPYISSLASFPFVTTLLVLAFLWYMFKGSVSRQEIVSRGTL